MELDELLEQALSLANEADWAGAAELLRERLADFDEEPAVHCWLGVAERELGLEGVAYERFIRAIELGPEDPYILATAGSGLAVFDDPGAENALRTAAIMAPELAVTRLMYGAYLSREGFFEQALAELEAARKLDEQDPQIAYELGVGRMLSGDVEGAADAMGEAVSLDPDDGWMRVALGLVLVEGDRAEEAAAELVEGARSSPEDVAAQLMASLAASVVGRDGLAYEMLERARLHSLEGDLALVTQVEDCLEAGAGDAGEMLREAMGPDELRRRLQERP